MPIRNDAGEIIGSYDPELEAREEEEARWEADQENQDWPPDEEDE
jgi:hypothetical protein